jgi:hypothetical protein
MFNRRTSLVALTGVAAAIALLPATVDAAGPRYKIDFTGDGTYTLAADGSAVVTAHVNGRPFAGASTTVLAANDGSLPAPGACEPATVTVSVAGDGRDYMELTATGDVCGQFVQPPYIATHVFTGRYTVVDASKRNLVGTDGFLEVRLAESTAQAAVAGIDT